jgi:hypothetical protein
MIRETNAAQESSSSPLKKSPLSQLRSLNDSSASSSEVGTAGTLRPHDHKHGRQRSVESLAGPTDYAWLDLVEPLNDLATTTMATTPSTTSPARTQAKRVSSVFLTRSESLRRQAENNRLELANLERSGSGASRTQLRPAYPKSKTPEDNAGGERKAEPRAFF